MSIDPAGDRGRYVRRTEDDYGGMAAVAMVIFTLIGLVTGFALGWLVR